MKRRSKTVLLTLGIVVASVLAFTLVPAAVLPGDFGLLKTYSRGPISTSFPAAWSEVCARGPVSGVASTNNEIPSQLPSMGPPSGVNLTKAYSAIIATPGFMTATAGGRTWVTIYWGLQDDSGPGYAYEYVIGQFTILSRSAFGYQFLGVIQGNYNLQTGNATSDSDPGVMCG
jgi:hypothetical protein